MKKIIAIFLIMFGFSYAANAQQSTTETSAQEQKTAAIQQAALKDVTDLNKVVNLSNQQMQDFKGLFVYKHKELAELTESPLRRQAVYESIEAKINAGLTEEQKAKIVNNKELMKQLIH